SFTVDVDDETFLDRRYGVPVKIDVTFTLADTHTYDTITIRHSQDDIWFSLDAWFYTTVEPGVGGSTTVTVPLPSPRGSSTVPDHCLPRDQTVVIYMYIMGNTGEVRDDDG